MIQEKPNRGKELDSTGSYCRINDPAQITSTFSSKGFKEFQSKLPLTSIGPRRNALYEVRSKKFLLLEFCF